MPYTDEHLAHEARRLMADPVLAKAIEDIRKDALDDLASVDPFNTESVVILQAQIRAVDNLILTLGRFIEAARVDT